MVTWRKLPIDGVREMSASFVYFRFLAFVGQLVWITARNDRIRPLCLGFCITVAQ